MCLGEQKRDRDAMERPPYDGSAPAPRVVNIETTKYCNLRCRMCIQFLSGSTVKGPHMAFDHFEEIADQVFPFVDVWQPSVAGEPILTPRFGDMLDLGHAWGLGLDMTTNGTLQQGAAMDRVVRDLRQVQFSFDAPTKASFEQIRVGATFEKVVANILALQSLCEQQRSEDRPMVELSVTLMQSNVCELPDLVDFAAETLRVDAVQVMHVFPANEDVRRESLVSCPELAASKIREAERRAVRHGLGFVVYPLAPALVATVRGSGERARLTADAGDHFDGLGEIRHDSRRQARLPRRTPKAEARRADRAASSSLPRRSRGSGRTDLPRSIPYCPQLWRRAYVHLDNSVLPCCMPGAPTLGYLHDQPFEELWNNRAYRAMRQRLLGGDPVPVCRGCQWLQTTEDPGIIAEVLADMAQTTDWIPLPDCLLAGSSGALPTRTDAAPTLAWDPIAEAMAYRIEFSLDRFYNLDHSAPGLSPDGPFRYEVPEDLWRMAPAHRGVFWRVMARLPGSEDRVVKQGLLPPEVAMDGVASAGTSVGHEA